MAENFDFQIDNLKFRAATSDKFPYARATAPFRKEQFDSAPTVGDQSLSGWWTRGQLSFHKGAGVEYYEVLDGDEVLNRFQDSLHVQVTTPGKATLDPEPVAAISPAPTAAQDMVAHNSGLAWIDGGTVYQAFASTTSTSVTLPGGVTGPNALATNGDYVFIAAGSGHIVRLEPSLGSLVSLYTHSAPLVEVWYAKGRLWALSDTGDLFAVAWNPSGALPVALGSPQFSLGMTINSNAATLTASPGDVYLSVNRSEIFRVSLDADGGVPTLASPVLAADLPQGEKVKFLRYYLGFVVIATNRGVRVAQVIDGNGLVYGPLLFEWQGTRCRSIGAQGTCVYVTGAVDEADGAQAVFEVNLLENLDDGLQFAWRRVREFPAPQNVGILVGGVTEEPTMGLLFWDEGVALRNRDINVGAADTLPREATGELVTAYHRFGTLDAKHFHEVLVRSEGAGSIAVARVNADGSEVPLVTSEGAATMDASVQSATFSLGLDAPVERIALKFTLSRDAAVTTSGPVLLGYQIKALPSPVRQRLIKWPLLIQDVYRDRYGVTRGTRDGAWDAWEALEALEEADALVTFTDHRTGETGSAYIESLELQTDTPSKGASTGFGGVGYATLRKVT